MVEKATVHEAISAVMADVQTISKDQRVESGPARFNFRGVDAVVNAVGPALRKHGVIVAPQSASIEFERYQTNKGASMRNATVRVEWLVIGPDGSSIKAATYGEAADSGDKAVSKAQSVAYRTVLLQLLCIPTDEPDPDQNVHERAPQDRPPMRAAEQSKPDNWQQWMHEWSEDLTGADRTGLGKLWQDMVAAHQQGIIDADDRRVLEERWKSRKIAIEPSPAAETEAPF